MKEYVRSLNTSPLKTKPQTRPTTSKLNFKPRNGKFDRKAFLGVEGVHYRMVNKGQALKQNPMPKLDGIIE